MFFQKQNNTEISGFKSLWAPKSRLAFYHAKDGIFLKYRVRSIRSVFPGMQKYSILKGHHHPISICLSGLSFAPSIYEFTEQMICQPAPLGLLKDARRADSMAIGLIRHLDTCINSGSSKQSFNSGRT